MRTLVDLFFVFFIIFCISFSFSISTQAEEQPVLGLTQKVEPRFFTIQSAQSSPDRQFRSIRTVTEQAKSAESSRFHSIDRGRPATHYLDPKATRPKRNNVKPVTPPFLHRANLNGGTSSWVLAEQTAPTRPEPAQIAAIDPARIDSSRIDSGRMASSRRIHWPVDLKAPSRISSRFGWRNDPFSGRKAFHSGLDIAAPTGTLVYATMAAKVKAIGEHPRLGRYVMLDHGNDLVSIYGHLSTMSVSTGDTLAPGDIVGKVGSTGRSTGPHLDYAIEYRGKRVDPLKLLKAPTTLARG